MKIVILNECFFGKEHLERLRELGDVIIYSDTNTEERTVKRLKEADIGIGDQFIAKFGKKVLEDLPRLKLLALNTTSFGYVDVETARKTGLKIANCPGFSKQSVAEFTIGLLFTINRKIALGDRMMRNSVFELDPGRKDHQTFIGFELKGKTLGILGLGNIGTSVAILAKKLGMKVIAYTRTQKIVPGVSLCSLQDLFTKSDVVSIHLPLNSQTKNLIGETELSLMKHHALLINTSQPEIVNVQALYNALNTKRIGGAALDVGTRVDPNHPIFKIENIVITPHAGSFTREAFFENLPNMILKNVEAFIKGKPSNLVTTVS